MKTPQAPLSIAVIGDEDLARMRLARLLSSTGNHVDEFPQAHAFLEKDVRKVYHVVITDLKMPGIDGLELIPLIKARHPLTVIVVMTDFGTIATAVEAMRLGAFDYITKPINDKELILLAERIRVVLNLLNENKALRDERQYSHTLIPGHSPSFAKVIEQIEQVAPLDISLLLIGETGTGKEVLAEHIHRCSNRSYGPLIKVSCAALSKEIVDSELFGHEKGAFTGAAERHIGRFEKANTGTIFIDEVDDIPLNVQVKLLRVLQEREIERVGGKSTIAVDVRVIAATKVDLVKKANAGEFRHDLFYRLSVMPINLPPLRERRQDIPDLLSHFMVKFAKIFHKPIPTMHLALVELLTSLPWPGNVRELSNICASLVASVGNRPQITVADYQAFTSVAPCAAVADLVPEESWELQRQLDELERRMIEKALAVTDGNKSKAAELLGLKRTTFNYMHKKHGFA